MDSEKLSGISSISGRVLVVDDDQVLRAAHRGILARQFDVITAASGNEAIELCHQHLPDLILLDIEMPEQDGIAVCRSLREWTSIPIIFATVHDSLEVHVRAYDAGGNDIVTKPVVAEILLRKVALAIRQYRTEMQLAEEKSSMQQMAMHFLSSMGHGGTLLNFMRTSIVCRSHRELAQILYTATSELGVECSVMIRHEGGPTVITAEGEPTPSEFSILEKSSAMGRIFQFKRRLVVNYDRVSIIIKNMPAEGEAGDSAGRLRDNVAILAETAEGLAENVDMRIESMARAEQMQVALYSSLSTVEELHAKYLLTLGDTRLILQELVDTVENAFSWVGMSREQELKISNDMDRSVQLILKMLSEESDFEHQFGRVLDALRGGQKKREIDLF